MREERLRAVVRMAQAMAGASDVPEVARVAAGHARTALDAALTAVSVWDRAQGRLRVLVNDGALAPGEEPEPRDESYPVASFPEIAADGPLPSAWIEHVGGDGPRANGLRRRGRSACVVAPILLEGRAWGELYAARGPGAVAFGEADAEFATVLAGQVSAGLAQTERLAEVRRLAFTDPLTGLANRRAVDDRLGAALERHRTLGSAASLIVCDVNGLKRLNDERGHDVGDRLLERFADQLSLAAATLPDSLAARLGGDEFCVVVDGAPADAVVAAAEEVCRAALAFPEGEGVACGVASTADPVGPVESAARLFRLADAAQYRAKAARSALPVVAGRGDRPDAVVRLADEAARAAREAAGGRRGRPGRRGRGGERRRFRGAVHSADPVRLLEAVLAALDADADPDAADPAPGLRQPDGSGEEARTPAREGTGRPSPAPAEDAPPPARSGRDAVSAAPAGGGSAPAPDPAPPARSGGRSVPAGGTAPPRHGTAPPPLPPPPDETALLARLVTVADTTARMLDAAAWTIHRTPPGGRLLELAQYSVQRCDQAEGPPGGDRLDPARLPLAARAARGGAFLVDAPDAEAGPPDGRHRALLAGGVDAAGRSWLLRLLGDGRSPSGDGLAPVLRTLVAAALLVPPSAPAREPTADG